MISRLAQAEEAWRRLLARDGGGERWERIKEGEKDLLEYLAGTDASLPRGIEDLVSLLAANSRALRVLGLRPTDAIKGVEWEAWAKGYFLELDAVTAGDMSSGEFGTRKLAKLLVERRAGEEPDRDRVGRVLQKLHDTWRARHAGGNSWA